MRDVPGTLPEDRLLAATTAAASKIEMLWIGVEEDNVAPERPEDDADASSDAVKRWVWSEARNVEYQRSELYI